jgi:hypothetical protein
MQLFRERQGRLEIDTSILPDWRQHGYDFLEPDSDNNIRNIKSEREGRPDEIKVGEPRTPARLPWAATTSSRFIFLKSPPFF